MSNERTVKVARAIGSASHDKDVQFAAKHWDRVADETSEIIKARLLLQAEAAIKTSVGDREGEGVKLPGCFEVGDWVEHDGRQYIGNIIAAVGGKLAIAWYPTKEHFKKGGNTSLSTYEASHFKGYTRQNFGKERPDL